MNDIQDYLNSLRMERDILDMVLGGVSAIDTRTLRLPDENQAERFLDCYGYDLSLPVDAAEVTGIYHESLQFIKKHFLKPDNPQGADLEIPSLFLELTDIKNLLSFSADRSMPKATRRMWACSILKIMHTIAHLDKDIRTLFFSVIQQQVFDRFYKVIYNVDGNVFLGDPKGGNSIELLYFQTKPRKARDSAILKLLHKPENVSEDLFDQVGIRFVSKTRMDTLRIVKFLCDNHVIMPINTKPSRSRNSLVDPFLYRRIWREVRNGINRESLRSTGEVNAFVEKRLREESLTDQNKKAMERNTGKIKNPFSSDSYLAIQFTCRQLIKYQNPVYNDIKKLKREVKKSGSETINKLADRIDLGLLRREHRFFYPFEVQIMDAKGYEESQSGEASHEAYKAAQRQMGMKRILGNLLKLNVS